MSRDRATYLLLGIAMMIGFIATRGLEPFWDGLGWGFGVGAVAAFAAGWGAWKRENAVEDQPSE